MTAEITWRELAKHNTQKDAWLSVRGKVYDVTEWLSSHPGGRDVLLLNAGRDATQLFEAYHPQRVYATLSKYEVGTLTTSEHPTFAPMSPFYSTLRSRVEQYFKDNKIKPNHAPILIFYSVLLVLLAFGSHYGAVSFAQTNAALCIFFTVLSGIAAALISLIPVHEASHASICGIPWLTRIFGAMHDFVNGASFYMWCHQHFLGHHPYTNVDGVDPDVSTNDPDVRRIKHSQPLLRHYRLQQIYAPFLYGLLAAKFRLGDLTMMFFSRMNGQIRVNPPGAWHYSAFILGKLFWVTYKFVLPYVFLGVPAVTLLGIIFFSDLVVSWYLAFVFQVNHVVSPAVWPKVDKETGIVQMDWAELQVRSTVDYAHGSWLTTFLSGALNYQVTHHLFPSVSQIYYPKIAPIVRKTCEEFDVPYVVLPTFWEAFKGHLAYLNIMGKTQ